MNGNSAVADLADRAIEMEERAQQFRMAMHRRAGLDEKLLAVREEMERGEVMSEAEFERLIDEHEGG